MTIVNVGRKIMFLVLPINGTIYNKAIDTT